MCKRIFAEQTSQVGDVPFYKIGTIGNTPDAYITNDLFLEYKQKYHFPLKGETLITCSGTVGKCIQYDGNPAYFQDSNIVWLRGKNTPINDNFLYLLLKNQDWSKLNSTTISRIYSNNLLELKYKYPDDNEQKIIVDFLLRIDKRIETQNKIIDSYKSLIKSIRNNIFATLQCDWKRLDLLIKDKEVGLKRGNIIPKHEKDNEYKYPVYSSSVQNNGLMGYSNYFMYNTELITWSIDGGGDIFYRKPHKFCVTNVCGIMELNKNKFNYIFVTEALKYQHSKMVFDYQTKAHPSVIEKLYSLPIISIDKQNDIAKLFNTLISRITVEEYYLAKLKEQKKYLLSNMFI